MKRAWQESQANWSVYTAGNNWEVAGAQGALDRGSISLGTLAATALGQYTLSLNASGIALVQSWIDNPANNQGLIIASSSNTDDVDFDSREAASAANRPSLTIVYTTTSTPTATQIPTNTFTPTATKTNPPTPTPLPTAANTNTPTLTPTHTFTPIPSPTNTLTPLTLHAGDLDRSSTTSGSRWNALVTISVHDANHNPVSGVTVSGSWSAGASGSSSCTTNTSGICTVQKSNLKSGVSSVTFTLTILAKSGYTYSASANHEPDGDSTGTSIVINKP